jgi:hypothetical protein
MELSSQLFDRLVKVTSVDFDANQGYYPSWLPLPDTYHIISYHIITECLPKYLLSVAIGRRYRRHDEIGTPFCITGRHAPIIIIIISHSHVTV